MSAAARNPHHGRHGRHFGSKSSTAAIKRALLRRAIEGDIAAAELVLKFTGTLPGEEVIDAGAEA